MILLVKCTRQDIKVEFPSALLQELQLDRSRPITELPRPRVSNNDRKHERASVAKFATTMIFQKIV